MKFVRRRPAEMQRVGFCGVAGMQMQRVGENRAKNPNLESFRERKH